MLPDHPDEVRVSREVFLVSPGDTGLRAESCASALRQETSLTVAVRRGAIAPAGGNRRREGDAALFQLTQPNDEEKECYGNVKSVLSGSVCRHCGSNLVRLRPR
ncbi:MAG TPA: hypothetical protein VFF88_05195, partial [Methylocella sp.]|nr:hypothetical protein [Methylocella sp.]